MVGGRNIKFCKHPAHRLISILGHFSTSSALSIRSIQMSLDGDFNEWEDPKWIASPPLLQKDSYNFRFMITKEKHIKPSST